MTNADEHAQSIPDLSVVVACDGAMGGMHESIDAVVRACAGLNSEIVLVHPSGTTLALPAIVSVPTRSIAAPSNLVPMLWGCGIADSRGTVVALTTTQFRVDPGWARALLEAVASQGVAGVGGRMAISPQADMLTRAAFFLRYSEHTGSGTTGQPRDIAGDNAAYVRSTVVRDYPNVASGFWEIDAHRLMRIAGEQFGRAPDAIAVFEPDLSLQEMISNRFVHGGHFGSYRVLALGWPRWKAVAVTPLVPFVLLARIFGRVRRSDGHLSAMLLAMPLMLLLLVVWAAGEARGAISATGRASDA